MNEVINHIRNKTIVLPTRKADYLIGLCRVFNELCKKIYFAVKICGLDSCSSIACYLRFLVVSSTVFSRSYTGVHSYRLLPFWSYREIFHYGRMDLLVENLLNIVLLMPVGLLLPVLNRKLKLKHIILAASVMSYTIELSQLIFCKGLFELFDDPFHNILGAVIGYGMYMGVKNWKCFEK